MLPESTWSITARRKMMSPDNVEDVEDVEDVKDSENKVYRDDEYKFNIVKDILKKNDINDPAGTINGLKNKYSMDDIYNAVHEEYVGGSFTEGEKDEIQDIQANMSNRNATLGTTARGLASIFGFDFLPEAQKTIDKNNVDIIKELKSQGYNAKLDNGTVLIENPNGEFVEIAPSVWDSISAAAAETIGGIGGGIYGAKKGATVGTVVGGPVGGIIGGIGGGIVGSGAGSVVDLIRTKYDLNQDLTVKKTINKFISSGLTDGAFSAILGGLGVTAKALKYADNKILNDFFSGILTRFKRDGSKPSNVYLKKKLNISDKDAKVIAKQFDQSLTEIGDLDNYSKDVLKPDQKKGLTTGIVSKQSQDSKEIQALALTDPRVLNYSESDTINRAKEFVQAKATTVSKAISDIPLEDGHELLGKTKPESISEMTKGLDRYDKLNTDKVARVVQKDIDTANDALSGTVSDRVKNSINKAINKEVVDLYNAIENTPLFKDIPTIVDFSDSVSALDSLKDFFENTKYTPNKHYKGVRAKLEQIYNDVDISATNNPYDDPLKLGTLLSSRDAVNETGYDMLDNINTIDAKSLFIARGEMKQAILNSKNGNEIFLIKQEVNKVDKILKKHYSSNKQRLNILLKKQDRYFQIRNKPQYLETFKVLGNPKSTDNDLIKAIADDAENGMQIYENKGLNDFLKKNRKLASKLNRAMLQKSVNESSVVDPTSGIVKAIDYPKLYSKIKEIDFHSDSAKDVQNMIKNMANIYKSDIDIYNYSRISKDSTYISAFPKQGLLNLVSDIVLSFSPTDSGRKLLLIRNLKELLDNPINPKNQQNFIRQFIDLSSKGAGAAYDNKIARQSIKQLVDEVAEHHSSNNTTGSKPIKFRDAVNVVFNSSDNLTNYRIDKIIEQLANDPDLVKELFQTLIDLGYTQIHIDGEDYDLGDHL